MKSYTIKYSDDKRNEETIDSAGTIEGITPGTEINFEISIIGSLIKLFIDGINICTGNMVIKENPVEIKIGGQNEVNIFNIEIEKKKLSAFIIT
ncbi:hypothetical protein [Marispirochaeta sp.]|uniref:hypothetical protein n=1 Tax=Marispirochaeta sp. TaxID=2038653 RepID=UPI0029C836B1|nr:hypothetical protein [Marispirochaeta sp.]